MGGRAPNRMTGIKLYTLKVAGHLIASILVLYIAMGAACPFRKPQVSYPLPPEQFSALPTIDQIAEQLNKSRGIQQLQANLLTIKLRGAPSIQGSLAWQRPRFFRVRGSAGIIGDVLDLGSNQDSFWMSVRQGVRPTLYVASHSQFERQIQRQVLPVSPVWLVEALGIVDFDPQQVVQPMQTRADGYLEVTSAITMAGQYHFRTLVLEPRTAVVRQILLRDSTGRLLATSTLSDHEYQQSVDYSLPRRVYVQLIPIAGEQLDLELEVPGYLVNYLQGDDASRWTMPDTRGSEVVDLVQLGATVPMGG